jgi:hypothetical protein
MQPMQAGIDDACAIKTTTGGSSRRKLSRKPNIMEILRATEKTMRFE